MQDFVRGKHTRYVTGNDSVHPAYPFQLSARDLARFGLLYLQNGLWNGKRLLSEDWIKFVLTPAPATASQGNFYGGQWWLVPDGRKDIPKDAYASVGNRGQYVSVVPSHNLVIIRRGLVRI